MLKKILSAVFLLVVFSFSAYAQEKEGKVGDNLYGENDITAEELYKVQPGDVVIGDEKAPITMIEYASMSCSHCAAFYNNTFPEIKEKYIDTGKVRFLFRDFPLDETALRGAMMARCAAKKNKDDFEKFVKAMFSTQSNWAPKKNYLEVLANIGKLGGMKGQDFDLCMADKELENSVMKSKFQAVKQLEVRSTPTFFVNKEMHKGANDIAYFSKVFEEILAAAPAKVEPAKEESKSDKKESPKKASKESKKQ